MTGAEREIFNGSWFWIEDEDVGVVRARVREGVSESGCVRDVCNGRCESGSDGRHKPVKTCCSPRILKARACAEKWSLSGENRSTRTSGVLLT